MCLQGAPSVSASRRPTPPRPAPATCGARTTWCWLTIGELRTDIWKSCMRRKLFLAKVTALCSSNSTWWQEVTWPWRAGNPSFSRKLTCSASLGWKHLAVGRNVVGLTKICNAYKTELVQSWAKLLIFVHFWDKRDTLSIGIESTRLNPESCMQHWTYSSRCTSACKLCSDGWPAAI